MITSLAGDPSREGKAVPNVSPHQVTVSLTLSDLSRLQVTVIARYLSRQFADYLNTQPIADFVVVDLLVREQLSNTGGVMLDAENLTDRAYVATQTGSLLTLGASMLIPGIPSGILIMHLFVRALSYCVRCRSLHRSLICFVFLGLSPDPEKRKMEIIL